MAAIGCEKLENPTLFPLGTEDLEYITFLLSILFTTLQINGNNVGFLIEVIFSASAKC